MGMRPRAARSQAREVWISKKENNIFDTTASRGTFFFYNDVWGAGARVVAVFLVVINRIYLHHNLERLIYAPSFSGIKCLRDKKEEARSCQWLYLSRGEVRGRLHFNPHVLS